MLTSLNTGIIQGRLSPLINKQIQSFPWNHWQDEFKIMSENGYHILEWTLDYERIFENPLIDRNKHPEIKALCTQYNISIDSLTGDFFMQRPFFKTNGTFKGELINILTEVLKACDELGVKFIIIPLVDNGSLRNKVEEDDLRETLISIYSQYDFQVSVAFESDYEANKLNAFISKFPVGFGINYDTGNSAALGFDPSEEIATYGHSIINVHLKDRLLAGGTVAFGKGATHFTAVINSLKEINYRGNFIFQGARDENNDHIGIINSYRQLITKIGQ